MGVILQGFYKMRPNQAVPSPADGNVAVPAWWDHIAEQAGDIARAGFTAVWLPPVLKTSAGAKAGSDGYGPFDDYDIGSKNQMGSVPTRFGTREQLQRCVAALRASGLDVYLDMVEHHRDGDPGNFVFRYRGANGTPDIGRFPKDPSNFVPQVPRDPNLGGPPADDFSFGRELAPINGKPHRYVFDNLIAASDWLTRALDVQGYRLDDVKGLSTDFLRPFLTSKSMAGKFAVGEFFDGNAVLVNGWVFNPRGMQGRSSAFDFPMRFVLAAMCNNPGQFNMADLDHVGLTGISPFNAVTFVENHDTDLSNGPVVTNKLMGYAYILTSEGYPCVYYRDYSTEPNCYGLKQPIDNLIWIHEKLASGPTQQRWKDFDVFAYERQGAPGLLVVLNNDPNNARTITVASSFGGNVPLHDYTGHAADVRSGVDGSVQITVPRNVNGLGYVCYSRAGIGGAFEPMPHAVTQVIEGAPDLDIGAAQNGVSVTVGRIWCAADSPIDLVLQPDEKDWTAATSIQVEVLGPDLGVRANSAVTRETLADSAIALRAAEAGFYSLRLTTHAAPTTNLNSSFSLSATYTGDPTFRSMIAAAEPRAIGQWTPSFDLLNVAIHMHLLPIGKVLYWGRRKQPTDNSFQSLNEWETHAFLLDPTTLKSVPTAGQPVDAAGHSINLFCSGHTFLPDGRLMVVGGHLFDSQGHNAATIYDAAADIWTAAAPMQRGRWYPSVLTLADGSAMVCSGSFPLGPPAAAPHAPHTGINNTPELWNGSSWKPLTDFNEQLDLQQFLYPRFHLAPDGRVFMSGAGGDSFFFDTAGAGTWTQSASRAAAAREYAPSVIYSLGKIVYIGGGSPPTDVVETIDLTQNPPRWTKAAPMHFARRQHNATLLPDGTVLVTGGTRGNGGPNQGFNDLTDGEPVHIAELWDPKTDAWTLMAAEQTDRCYHSTAVLLPDGRVLSAGGGEYQPDSNQLVANQPADTHLSAQIFSPPYLFKGPRPQILNCPPVINYGEHFAVESPQAAQIEKASLIRLSSVTHSFNANQRIHFLALTQAASAVTLTAPPNANDCPPGHYLLFLLDRNSIPSVGRIVHLAGAPPAAPRTAVRMADPVAKNAQIIASAIRPEVVIGLSSTCPYGLGACWGGAFAGLKKLTGVATVRPLPDPDASVAFVYLDHDDLPALDRWPDEFVRSANGSYVWRGVEVTLAGAIQSEAGVLFLAKTASRPRVELRPLSSADRVQKMPAGAAGTLPPQEANAFDNLATQAADAPNAMWTITGPLKELAFGFLLEVRLFRRVTK